MRGVVIGTLRTSIYDALWCEDAERGKGNALLLPGSKALFQGIFIGSARLGPEGLGGGGGFVCACCVLLCDVPMVRGSRVTLVRRGWTHERATTRLA